MLFSSIEFIFVFLPLSLGSYFLFPKRQRNAVLLFWSLIFYAWGEPKYVFLMAATILSDYLFGILIERYPRQAKPLLAFAVFLNLLSLWVFKYLSPALSLLGAEIGSIALPVGISFYTFQSLSYVIDVYMGQRAQKSLVDFGAYVTMFPQLVAGPIVRYGEVSAQLSHREESFQKAARGVLRFVAGLSKKLILANGAGAVWTQFSSLPGDALGTLGAWVGIIAFAFQIYFDFSGYSDMAIGLGQILGFDFPENFNYPYAASSLGDFWKRWHISLTDWFREYLYIPLGGNRRGKSRTLLNMLAVWLFTGAWHGASLGFILWGLYYFVLLACERFIWGDFIKRLPRPLKSAYSLFFILIGWVFFALPDKGSFLPYLKKMFSLTPPAGNEIYHVVRSIPFLILTALGSTSFPKEAWAHLARGKEKRIFALSLCSIFAFVLCLASLVGSSYNPFLYFRF
jgi:alginate O-acetyltransferase complex protein AlgI